MAKTIVQKVLFKNAAPSTLYQLYMDAKKHTEVTGSATKIQQKEGTRFSAWDGYCSGKNLHLVKDKMIVQTWRASDWNDTDADSIFMLALEAKGKDTILHVTHANVPDNQASALAQGWHDYYWKPWKAYIKANA